MGSGELIVAAPRSARLRVPSYPGSTLSSSGSSGEEAEGEMRTYDPADRICYVHLAQQPVEDACHRLPTGYANSSPGTRLGSRPALVLLPGGSAENSAPTPELRLAR